VTPGKRSSSTRHIALFQQCEVNTAQRVDRDHDDSNVDEHRIQQARPHRQHGENQRAHEECDQEDAGRPGNADPVCEMAGQERGSRLQPHSANSNGRCECRGDQENIGCIGTNVIGRVVRGIRRKQNQGDQPHDGHFQYGQYFAGADFMLVSLLRLADRVFDDEPADDTERDNRAGQPEDHVRKRRGGMTEPDKRRAEQRRQAELGDTANGLENAERPALFFRRRPAASHADHRRPEK
jgi:hypothetical protein